MSTFSTVKAEIENDPLLRGYSGMSNAEVVADMLTEYRTRNKSTITGKEISEAITAADYSNLDAAQKLLLINYLGAAEFDPFGFAQTVFVDLFAGTDTIQALAALRVESISRAEELGIAGVNEGDIGAARA